MLELFFVRHCSTEWNEQGRYQGHSDLPLSPLGEGEAKRLRIPAEWANSLVISSSLKRASQTAILALGKAPLLSTALVEQNFGSWEGLEIEAMKNRQEFCPPHYGWPGWEWAPPQGESYKEVADRLHVWAEDLSQQGVTRACVFTHKGVLLVLLALAYNWDLHSKRPFKIKPHCGFHLNWSQKKGFEVVDINIALFPG